METLELTLEEPYIDYRKPFKHISLSQTHLPPSLSNFPYLRAVNPEKTSRKGIGALDTESDYYNLNLAWLSKKGSYAEPIGVFNDKNIYHTPTTNELTFENPEESFRMAVQALDAGTLDQACFYRLSDIVKSGLISYETMYRYANDTLKYELFTKRLVKNYYCSPWEFIVYCIRDSRSKEDEGIKKLILSDKWYFDFLELYKSYLSRKYRDPDVISGFAALIPHIVCGGDEHGHKNKDKLAAGLLIKTAKLAMGRKRLYDLDGLGSNLRWTARWIADENLTEILIHYAKELERSNI